MSTSSKNNSQIKLTSADNSVGISPDTEYGHDEGSTNGITTHKSILVNVFIEIFTHNCLSKRYAENTERGERQLSLSLH